MSRWAGSALMVSEQLWILGSDFAARAILSALEWDLLVLLSPAARR